MRILQKNFLANSLMFFHFLWGVWILGGTALAVVGYFKFYPTIWFFYFFTLVANGIFVFFLKYCPLTIAETEVRLNSKNRNEPMEAFSYYWIKRITGVSIPSYSMKLLFLILYLLNFMSYMYWMR